MPFRQAAVSLEVEKELYNVFTTAYPHRRTHFFRDSPELSSFRWRPYQLEIQPTVNRLCSFVRLCDVRSLPGTGRSRVLMHFWNMPVKPRLSIHCAQHVSGSSKIPLLWTKYATVSRYHCSHLIQSLLVFLFLFVARRGETCRCMPTLQSEIQIAIRPRPTLARLVCSSQLSRLRRRSRRYKCPRYGEDLT